MFSFFPQDDLKQTLRIRRFLIACVSYIIWYAICLFAFLFGMTAAPLYLLLGGLAGILACNISIYAAFRTGLNKRFKDPSLTLLQMVLATFWIMVVAYYADSSRSIVLLLYLAVFVFGFFKLSVWQFLFLSAYAVVNYAAVIFLIYKLHPESINYKTEILNMVVLSMVLPWFSLVGAYINKLRSKIARALSTIEQLSIMDDLTQVYNRRHMYKILGDQKALRDRGVHPFSICIFDLDYFKKVNDIHGHSSGDIVLKTVAQKVQKNIRNVDFIARYGGEEFILILTNMEIDESLLCAERIRKMVKELVFEDMPEDFRITISAGLTTYQSVEFIQDTINRADKALYRAKENGRDRVECEPTT